MQVIAINTCQVIICTVNRYHKVLLLLPDVGEQTPIDHEGHNNKGGRASIHTHSNNIEDMRVFKAVHFHTFFDHIYNSVLIKEPC